MDEVVQKVLATLQTKISGVNFNNWIKPAKFVIQDQVLFIEVPNKFIRDWITDNYLKILQYELYKITSHEHEVKFHVMAQAEPASTVSAPATQEDIASKAAQKLEEEENRIIQRGLNPKNDFDSFVVGSGNQFAHAASKAVANLPALAYNPLFIYGGVGLGKTHLLNAIGVQVKRDKPETRVLYVHAEHFTNELIASIRYEKMYEFRKKYRESCDVLLIDDIQFIGGKERTQEEFFHTFNYLYESRRQIALTSDRFPKDIPQLEERLRSRFEWGLIADIQVPDMETRVAILHKKAETDKIKLPNEVAMFLATRFRRNVRELEGSLIRVGAFCSLSKCELTIDSVKEALKDILPNRGQKASVEAIQKLVADFYKLKINDLKSPRRLKSMAVPRQIAMYLSRKHVKASYPTLGMKFGGKDHSTVVHAVRKITKLLETDPSLQDEVQTLEKHLEYEVG